MAYEEFMKRIRTIEAIFQRYPGNSDMFPSDLVKEYIKLAEEIEGKSYEQFTIEERKKYRYLEVACSININRWWEKKEY